VLSYSTYWGTTGADAGNAITVDGQGEAFLTGQTPGSASNSSEAFVVKLNSSGSAALYTAVLGGTSANTSSAGNALAVDGSGAAVLGGFTTASNYPTLHAYQSSFTGSQDAVVSKLSAQGNSLAFSTFFAGAGTDSALGVALDGSGNVAFTGWTTSGTNFPLDQAVQTTFGGGGEDAFVAELAAAGSSLPGTGLLFSTLLGGAGAEEGHAIVVGPGAQHGQNSPSGSGSVSPLWVTGWTTSSTLAGHTPTAIGPGGGKDVLVAELEPGPGLLALAKVGGSGDDLGNGIALDSNILHAATIDTFSKVWKL
jgi:hypothetical protein